MLLCLWEICMWFTIMLMWYFCQSHNIRAGGQRKSFNCVNVNKWEGGKFHEKEETKVCATEEECGWISPCMFLQKKNCMTVCYLILGLKPILRIENYQALFFHAAFPERMHLKYSNNCICMFVQRNKAERAEGWINKNRFSASSNQRKP